MTGLSSLLQRFSPGATCPRGPQHATRVPVPRRALHSCACLFRCSCGVAYVRPGCCRAWCCVVGRVAAFISSLAPSAPPGTPLASLAVSVLPPSFVVSAPGRVGLQRVAPCIWLVLGRQFRVQGSQQVNPGQPRAASTPGPAAPAPSTSTAMHSADAWGCSLTETPGAG